MNDALPLAGRCGLVTGASHGIGRAVAVRLAELGADVALVQRSAAEESVAAVAATGRRAHVIQADQADAAAAARAVAEAAEALGRLDIAVCNAALTARRPLLDLDLEDWRRVVDVNLTGTFVVSRAAARAMVAQGQGGRVIHIGSQLCFLGGVEMGAYAATKGALVQLAKAQSNEWAPHGIRVNVVAPSWTVTKMTAPVLDDDRRLAEINARIPAGRWGAPEDTAAVVGFLSTPAADYVTGVAIPVDGGFLAR